jgi:nitrate/nitrite-specific signal transduction histidine kinase
MKLNIKTKVFFGILFIFVEFFVIGAISIYYFSEINTTTGLMIKNNYKSVQYSENMIKTIDEVHLAVTSLILNKSYHFDKNSLTASQKSFEDNLNLEKNNITETGERELAESVHQKYLKYKTLIDKIKIDSLENMSNFYFMNILPLYNEIKTDIFSISNLNMHAIIQRNDNLNEMIITIYKNLSIVFTICFLLTFTFVFNFPNYIAKPIKEITENIKEMANKKFKTVIKFSSHDEFNQLSEAFDFMVDKVSENYKPVIVEKVVAENRNFEEKNILQNIQELLLSVSKLMVSLEKLENKDLLQKQSEIINKVGQDLSKIIQ